MKTLFRMGLVISALMLVVSMRLSQSWMDMEQEDRPNGQSNERMVGGMDAPVARLSSRVDRLAHKSSWEEGRTSHPSPRSLSEGIQDRMSAVANATSMGQQIETTDNEMLSSGVLALKARHERLVQQGPFASGLLQEQPQPLEFLHITKTGGSAVEHAGAKAGMTWGICHFQKTPEMGEGCQFADWEWPHSPHRRRDIPAYAVWKGELWHTPGHWMTPNPYARTKTFTIVRDPYERAISEYYCKFFGYHRDEYDGPVKQRKGKRKGMGKRTKQWIMENVRKAKARNLVAGSDGVLDKVVGGIGGIETDTDETRVANDRFGASRIGDSQDGALPSMRGSYRETMNNYKDSFRNGYKSISKETRKQMFEARSQRRNEVLRKYRKINAQILQEAREDEERTYTEDTVRARKMRRRLQTEEEEKEEDNDNGEESDNIVISDEDHQQDEPDNEKEEEEDEDDGEEEEEEEDDESDIIGLKRATGNDSKGRRKDSPLTLNRWLVRILRRGNRGVTGHLLPQSLYIFDENGNRVVDHVIRYENLDEEFKGLMDQYNMNVTLPQARTNVGHTDDENKRMTVDDLDTRTIQLINAIYARDFELLGYTKREPKPDENGMIPPLLSVKNGMFSKMLMAVDAKLEGQQPIF